MTQDKALNILLLEDNAYDAELVLHTLGKSSLKFNYKCIDNRKDFLKEISTPEWDIILSDYSMNRFTASDALDILQEKSLDIPLIIISGTIGEEVAVFEPTHGSAPKYETLQPSIVNPIAMILSACMMLDHIGEDDKSKKIKEAIGAVIKEQKVQTYDMKKLRGGPKALEQGAASTDELVEAILGNM